MMLFLMIRLAVGCHCQDEECIVNAGENLVVSSSSYEEYSNTKRSSTKMGGVIERASCTLPSMITLLL